MCGEGWDLIIRPGASVSCCVIWKIWQPFGSIGDPSFFFSFAVFWGFNKFLCDFIKFIVHVIDTFTNMSKRMILVTLGRTYKARFSSDFAVVLLTLISSIRKDEELMHHRNIYSISFIRVPRVVLRWLGFFFSRWRECCWTIRRVNKMFA